MPNKQLTETPPAHRLLWLVSFTVALVLVLTGGIWALTRSFSSPSSGHTLVPPVSSTPKATSTSTFGPARVIYTADWSHGAGGWSLPSSVQVKSGTLVFTGAGDVNLTIPCAENTPGASMNEPCVPLSTPISLLVSLKE